jgi:hypothetical protein
LTGCNLPTEDKKATMTMEAAIIQVKTHFAIQDKAVKTAIGFMKLTEIAKPTASSSCTPTLTETKVVPSQQTTQTPQIIIIQMPTQSIVISVEPTKILFPTPAPLEMLPLLPTIPPLGTLGAYETLDPSMPLPTLAGIPTWFPDHLSDPLTE